MYFAVIKRFSFALFSVEYLANLYIEGESTYLIEQEDKVTNIVVNRKLHVLSPEATNEFEKIYNEWEETCEKFPCDPLIGGV